MRKQSNWITGNLIAGAIIAIIAAGIMGLIKLFEWLSNL